MSTSTSKSPSLGTRNWKSATTNKAERLRAAIRKGWTPPPRISLPEWADTYRRLAKEAGSTTGKWETSTVEIARGPMMAVTETGVRKMSLMVSTQLMKTALLENIIGYFAHLDPCPILMIQPKEQAALDFSKERISPLIRVTPALRKIMGSKGKSRNKDETLAYKAFPGGFLALVGAGSPDNLARRPVRLILADEVDKYEMLKKEGEPVKIAEERMATFGANSLSVRVCSPTEQETSRIEKFYEQSDQRRATVCCPHCQHRTFLDFFKHVHWDKDGDTHLPDTARLYCEGCGVAWSEGDRLNALQTARWHQTRPFTCCGVRIDPRDYYDLTWKADPVGAVDKLWTWSESRRHAVYLVRCPTCGGHPVSNAHAGFQAGKMYSPWSADRPQDMAAKFVDALGDEESVLVFYNTQLGLPYRKNSGREIRVQTLLDRRELWDAELVDETAIITIGVDVQDYRLEIEVVAWGRDEESWSVDYHVIQGEFSDPDTQKQLDEYLKRAWYRADGRAFVAKGVCIDSGGHHTHEVYKFCKARLGRRVWAIKGESAQGGQRNPVWPTKTPNKRNKSSFRPVILGVNAAKDTISSRLQKEEPGAGYMHFPESRDVGYFEQLTAERSVFKFTAGHKYRVWEARPGRANEALDCRVYAYAALQGLLHMGLKLNTTAMAVAKTIGQKVARPAPAAAATAPTAAVAPPAAPEPAPGRKRRSTASRLA